MRWAGDGWICLHLMAFIFCQCSETFWSFITLSSLLLHMPLHCFLHFQSHHRGKKKGLVGTVAQPVWGHISLLSLLVFARVNADVSLPTVLFYDTSLLNAEQPGGGSTPYLRIPLLFFWSVVQGDWASWAYSLSHQKCIPFLLHKSVSRAMCDRWCCMLILLLLSGGAWLARGNCRC